jgi:hypothetical protein
MRANPGGQLAPSEVVGRDELILRLWEILQRQSLVLSAERRMGKTSVIKKMIAEAPGDKLPVYHDLEGLRTPMEFARAVFDDVDEHLGRMQRTGARMREFIRHLGGVEVGGLFKLPDKIEDHHWKTLLTRTLEDLVEHQTRRVILFWDEMPMMLDNIKQDSGEKAAMEMLDTLRSLRQMHEPLRMVFTGSIGLHNVITSLKRAGYANAPINDMYVEDVPPLSPEDANELARLLLEGEDIPTTDLPATSWAIASEVDGIAHYIHHVVDQMRRRGIEATVQAAREIVDEALTDPLDRWHMRHYRERMDTYYTAEELPFALSLLDVLAAEDKPLAFADLFNQFRSRQATEDVESIRSVLTLLQRDHYVTQQKDGRYAFRFPLIRRWWRLHRGV